MTSTRDISKAHLATQLELPLAGELARPAYAGGGLGVYKSPGGWTKGTWGVLHVTSGRLVLPCAMGLEVDARACLDALRALPIDWTVDDSPAWSLSVCDRVWPLLRQWLPKTTHPYVPAPLVMLATKDTP